ncbi:unnamed protein product [Orchesella dallaii]|uniref:Lipase domain-containing protein n=1 Tax=Orchesella dallaii TaxID=48710 RepID=A0ABP1RK73_9HEXA
MGTNYFFLLLFFLALTCAPLLVSGDTTEEPAAAGQDADSGELAATPEEAQRMEEKAREREKYRKKGLNFIKSLMTDNTEKGKTERVKNIRFLLRNHESDQWIALKNDASDASLVWNEGGKVKVIMHGWTPLTWKVSAEIITDQFQIGEAYTNSSQDINAIVVDWTCLSKEPAPKYFRAAASTKFAGEAVGNFLVKLSELGLIKEWNDVHLIGFSLGGHVAGVAGYTVLNKTNSKVGRITGLDPAGPSFDYNGELPPDRTKVLDKEDAEFVDIIHCNMGALVDMGKRVGGRFGSTVQAGHADFYPNGGSRQPGCSFLAEKKGCSHTACNEYFRDSISRPMPACPCKSWEDFQGKLCECTEETGGVNMGEPCQTKFDFKN